MEHTASFRSIFVMQYIKLHWKYFFCNTSSYILTLIIYVLFILFVHAIIVLTVTTQFLCNYDHLQQHLFIVSVCLSVSTASPLSFTLLSRVCILHYHFAGAVESLWGCMIWRVSCRRAFWKVYWVGEYPEKYTVIAKGGLISEYPIRPNFRGA